MNTPSPDEVISEIAQGQRKVAPGDGALVRDHIAKAPFNREPRLEKEWSVVGDTVVGCPHPTQQGVTISEKTSLTSLERHLAKRIRDGQWLPSTTPTEYEADCQRAASLASVVKAGLRVVPLAATQTHAKATDFPRMKLLAGQVLLVVYDTAKRRITTSYYLPEADAPIRVYKYWVQNPRPVVLPLSSP